MNNVILVVDDEPTVLKFTAFVLKQAGYMVEQAGSMSEGREAFKKHQERIALAIVDLKLPDGDGMKLVNELRADKPGIKILASSGNLPDNEQLCGTPHLQKPYSIATLNAAIKAALTNYQTA